VRKMKDGGAGLVLGVEKGKKGLQKLKHAEGRRGRSFFHPVESPGNNAYFFLRLAPWRAAIAGGTGAEQT
jgi:hypothetical protein